jgi:hypothetical protein
MTLLESAMAFAVVMIIFSTLVTGIVEAILRSLGTRETNLQKTIEALFDQIVWPRLQDGLKAVYAKEHEENGNANGAEDDADDSADNGKSEQPEQSSVKASMTEFLERFRGTGPVDQEIHRERFVRDLTDNPVIQPGSDYNPERKSKIDALSLLAFAERLGRSDVGKAILAEGEDQVELLVKDLARGFDRFGRAASEVFRKKAQLTAICVAIPFAWMVNIDASRLLDQLINNPDIRSNLIEQAQEANVENEVAAIRLEELKAQIEAYYAQQDSNSSTASADLEPADARNLQQQLQDVSERLEQSIQSLEDQGLEVGWLYYPYCNEGNSDDACNDRVGWKKADGSEASTGEIVWTMDFAVWLFMSTLAGVLIGLGGPFWFRVFSSLSQVFQALRALGLGARKPAKDEPSQPNKATEDPVKPVDVLDAFTVAAKVNQQVSSMAS